MSPYMLYLLLMPKYWGKQILAHGSFPEVGEKQKTEKKEREKERRAKVGNNNGQLRMSNATSCGARKANWAKNLKSNPEANYHDIGLLFGATFFSSTPSL